jgi:antitoxin CcdA
MKFELYDPHAPKRAANLSINRDLLARAKAAGIPLSQTLEEALAKKLRAKREADWKSENREAVESYNQQIEQRGAFGDEFRRF